ncbi:lipoyl(octanoyl) transferase LipB [Fulvivirgaceae bacterium BMA12]|uniref:Octanoyltransferase n=1 Tax=Agaribacillus aureus TaxID=3051825 RepID=A0ABT8L6V1_9BACT|nr:lipoyl(octanoyl) transferase LipB [Fulvivirgaceae bacterium BMA12]
MNLILNRKVTFRDLGLVDYQKGWDYQEELFRNVVAVKISNRKVAEDLQQPTPNYLLFCEHPHVYTLGKSGDANNLLLQEKALEGANARFYRINRGGDITYHGPGQIVGYPILDLDNFFTDIHKYLRLLEEAVINTLAEFEVKAGRIDGLTGVWIDFDNRKSARKICALGVRSSRWVTMHGFAFNVNTNLDYFNHIVPCGIADKDVTSLARELGYEPDMAVVKKTLLRHLAKLFDMELITENVKMV